jgi:uncharacterized metal-binding protein YceD (DUF177 family)
MTRPAHEFSRTVDVSQLPPQGRIVEIEADPVERKAVAQRLALLDLPKLTARYAVKPLGAGAVRVDGMLQASVVQQCVVTLAPLPVTIAQDFFVSFSRDGAGAGGHEVDLSPDEDTPEILVDGEVDLGEIAVEQLALHLNPYPRAPNARFEPVAVGGEARREAAVSPFAALAKLKTGRENK